MAEEARLPEIQADLLALAWRFERMADLFEGGIDAGNSALIQYGHSR